MTHDVEVTLQITTAVVILALQSVNLWRSWRNAVGITRNTRELENVGISSKEINAQLHIIRQAITKIEALNAGREKPYGRRKDDVPPADPPSTMLAPRTSWPIADGPLPT